MIQPLDLEKIRGKWHKHEQFFDEQGRLTGGQLLGEGDDTESSLKAIGEKVNEVIEQQNLLTTTIFKLVDSFKK